MENTIKKIKIPKLGMRSFKTFLSVFASLLISNLFGLDSFQATWTAFLCMQGSLIETTDMARVRGVGTLIGSFFSFIYLLLAPDILYIIPIGVLIIIYVGNILNKTEYIKTASLVFLVISFRIVDVNNFQPADYVLNRTLETFIGLGSALIINYYIKPPNPFVKLNTLDKELKTFLEDNLMIKDDYIVVRTLEGYRLKMDEFRNLIQFYHKEINSKKHNVDIKKYMNHLDLYRKAYSHMFVLMHTKNGMSESVKDYHIESINEIKNKLLVI
ncbi:MAG: aromatic acid exporter family protein [Bacillota bacterium]|nr:aromatic acid exporter family protein [Bacillota bacterium]